MFPKLSLAVTAVLATLAAATPTDPSPPGTVTQCCNSVQQSNSVAVSTIAALLGINLGGVNVPVGLNCSPITVLGNNCGNTQVTCNAPAQQCGLIVIGCIPIVL